MISFGINAALIVMGLSFLEAIAVAVGLSKMGKGHVGRVERSAFSVASFLFAIVALPILNSAFVLIMLLLFGLFSLMGLAFAEMLAYGIGVVLYLFWKYVQINTPF